MTAMVLVTASIFIWGTLSGRLERADLTAPIVFMGLGALLAGLGLVDAAEAPESLRTLVEVALVWVLFADVAPTDAAPGVPVVTNPVVPSRIRRLITVESGLNDGIATPVVLLTIAAAASAEGLADAPGLGEALAELAIGGLVGAAVGAGGGRLLQRARTAGWAGEDFAGIAVLVLALLAYAAARGLHGNGFIAAFCGGVAFGAAAGRRARGPERGGGAADLPVRGLPRPAGDSRGR